MSYTYIFHLIKMLLIISLHYFMYYSREKNPLIRYDLPLIVKFLVSEVLKWRGKVHFMFSIGFGA